jgi:hypothetical protein
MEHTIMKIYNAMKLFAGKPEKWFGLDGSMVSQELVPVVVNPKSVSNLKRIR